MIFPFGAASCGLSIDITSRKIIHSLGKQVHLFPYDGGTGERSIGDHSPLAFCPSIPRPPLRHMSAIERLPLTHGATFGPRHYCVSKGVGRSTKLSLYVNLSFLCTLQAWSNIVRVSRRFSRVSAFGRRFQSLSENGNERQ